MRISLYLISIFLLSCGTIDKMAIDATARIFYKAGREMETESNWENIKNGLMANLKIIEGLLYLDSDNEKLLAVAVKGYAGYAFAIDETLHLGDYLADNGQTKHLDQGVFNYSKAFDYGLRFLEQKDISYKDLTHASKKKDGLVQLLDDKLADNAMNRETILFTAQSLISMINLQKDKVLLLAQLPVAKNLFEWACMKDPSIKYGSCHLFNGAYYASRPRILGGRPQEAKKEFESMIKKYPTNWLARVAYMQYYLIPTGDKSGYRRQKKAMEKLIPYFDRLQRWMPNRKKDGDEHVRIYQSIALKRYEMIKKNEKDLF